MLRSKAYWGYDEDFMQAAAHFMVVTPKFLKENRSFVLEVDGQMVGFSSLVHQGETVVLDNLFIDARPTSGRAGASSCGTMPWTLPAPGVQNLTAGSRPVCGWLLREAGGGGGGPDGLHPEGRPNAAGIAPDAGLKAVTR